MFPEKHSHPSHTQSEEPSMKKVNLIIIVIKRINRKNRLPIFTLQTIFSSILLGNQQQDLGTLRSKKAIIIFFSFPLVLLLHFYMWLKWEYKEMTITSES